MFLNVILAILFVGSVGALWGRISEKIPELVAIPDEVIVARLREDSARIRIFFLHFKSFWREGRYKDVFRKFCEKIFYRTHIILMRLDHRVMSMRVKIHANGGNGESRDHLKSVDEADIKIDMPRDIMMGPASSKRSRPYAGHFPDSAEEARQEPQKIISLRLPRSRFGRMQEVRMKKSQKTPE